MGLERLNRYEDGCMKVPSIDVRSMASFTTSSAQSKFRLLASRWPASLKGENASGVDPAARCLPIVDKEEGRSLGLSAFGAMEVVHVP